MVFLVFRNVIGLRERHDQNRVHLVICVFSFFVILAGCVPISLLENAEYNRRSKLSFAGRPTGIADATL